PAAAAAQEGPTTGFAPPPPPPEPEPVERPEGVTEEVVRETFGDWTVVCLGESDFCSMRAVALNPEGSPGAQIDLVRLPRGGPALGGMTAIVPLVVLLNEGLVTVVDDGQPVVQDYDFCRQNGCLARFGLTEGQITEMRRGAVMGLVMSAVDVPQNPIVMRLSLTGFTAAWNSMRPQAR
ncbi:MAG: invasion associated locus B family protein, partial [Rubricella sp.]